jgi:hypothetical protein
MHARRFLCLLSLLPAAVGASAQGPSDDDLGRLHRDAGQALDRRYYAAGRRVDLVRFDLEELGRQGRPAPRALVATVNRTDAALRSAWQTLENSRKAIALRIADLPPEGDHVLSLANAERSRGDESWFGIRSAAIVWENGARLDIPLSAFKGASVIRGYEYHVDAPADAVFAYGSPSPRRQLQAGFAIPPGAAGNARILLSGLDDDKPGVTPFRLSVDGRPLFEGAVPFRDDRWTESSFALPDEALLGTTPRDDAAQGLAVALEALRHDTDVFGLWADWMAATVEAASAEARKGLVWKPMSVEPGFWKNHFIRGVCHVPFEQEITHHFRSFRHLGANLLYSYTGLYNPEAMFPATLAAVKEVGIPYVQFAKELNVGRPNPLGLGETEETVARTRAYRRRVEGTSGVKVHIAVDEPKFEDKVADQPSVLREFGAWLEGRRAALARAGITLPADPKPLLKPSSDADRPLWMEWQMFKRHALARHLRALWDGLASDGVFTLAITQDLLSHAPQAASHVTLGEALPMLSNDLYSNGTVREAFVMDLQRHASKGPAILTAGAGYSDRTPSRFRRSLAVGMTHAEGVLQWTDVYFAKYRDPRLFWEKPVDDQGRDVLLSWDPRYWGIMEEEYARMARADRFLTGVTSTATAAVLYSERTAISDTATNPDPYTTNAVAVYSDLLRRSRPLDACFVESLTPEALGRYRVMVLPDARVMTRRECETLRRWVRNGGTLITSADTSLCDEWGRPQRDYALADVFGAHRTAAAGVAADGATVVARNTDGSPSVLKNVYGRGRCYLFTARDLGRRVGAATGSGLAGEGRPETVALLAGLVDSFSGSAAVRLAKPCDGIELQVFRKGAAYVVHLVDWKDDRTVRGLGLKVRLPGKWRARYPTDNTPANPAGGVLRVRPFGIHEMLVLEPEDSAGPGRASVAP